MRASDDAPNILFILTDDQRWDSMGCFGNPVVKTPAFDALARQGVCLDAFYAAVPLCCPSRATFLSGLYPGQSGVFCKGSGAIDLRRSTPTVATCLEEAGYVTGFVGKAHMGGDPRPWGFRETPLWLPEGVAPLAGAKVMREGNPAVLPGPVTRYFADEAISFIERHASDRWFLWLATTAPHTPFLRDPTFPYDAASIPPPPGLPPGTAMAAFDWAGYYSTISSLDREVGRVIDSLRSLHLDDRTLVLLASDNGLMAGSHGYQWKDVWFEESARTPAIVRFTGRIPSGTRCASPLSSADLLPTLCDAAGIDPPGGLEGATMLPALTGGTPRRAVVFAEGRLSKSEISRGDPWYMVRSGSHKLVASRSGEEMLYDLAADPHELRNLAKEPTSAALVAELKARLSAWGEPARSP